MAGGRYVTKVVGAVPEIVVEGLLVAVPPEMSAVVPAPPPEPSLTQVVTKVSTVELVAVAVVLINSPVYGAVELFNWNMVAGEVVS